MAHFSVTSIICSRNTVIFLNIWWRMVYAKGCTEPVWFKFAYPLLPWFWETTWFSRVCPLNIFFLFSGILKPFYNFPWTWAKNFVFLSCMYLVNKFAFTFACEVRQIQCTCLKLMLVQCTRPYRPRALDASNSVRVHWICLISLIKVNAHLLTSNQMLWLKGKLSRGR